MAARKQARDDGAKRGPGRPPRFAEGELKNITTWLRPSSALWLDGVIHDAKVAGLPGALSGEFSRSAIIRGILAAVEDAGVQLESCDSEEAVRAAVRRALSKRR